MMCHNSKRDSGPFGDLKVPFVISMLTNFFELFSFMTNWHNQNM